MKLRKYLTCFASFILLLMSAVFCEAENPNFLIIIADDCTFSDLPIYGGQNAKTPNIDKLASQGLTFNRAGICMAMCQPARSELYTGQYPMRNGAAWNHCQSYSETKSMPHYLRALGYKVGITGKMHIEPAQAYPFDLVKGFDSNCVRRPTLPHRLEGIRTYMEEGEDPFALVIALVEPHKPWVMGDPSAYPPHEIILPEYLVDHITTRESFASYLAEITYMDEQVGEILDVLEKSGKADNTVVLFTSEQGAQWPGCKWTNWDLGVHTALVARMPGKIPQGKRTDVLVQYADILPTLLDIIGDNPSHYPLDGFSFKSVLFEGAEGQRQYLYSMHNNIPEGPAYPIRAISDGRYKYIRNINDDALFLNKWIMGKADKNSTHNHYWQTWIWESTFDEKASRIVSRYMMRPEEELYDLQNDALEMSNLISNQGLHGIKQKLKRELDYWMYSQSDPGAELDTQRALESSRKLEHIFHY